MVFAGFSSSRMAAVCVVDFGNAGNGVDSTRASFASGYSFVVCVWVGGAAVGAECAVVRDCGGSSVSGAVGCLDTIARNLECGSGSNAVGECGCVGWGCGGGDGADWECAGKSGGGGAAEISRGGGGLD